MNESTGVDGVRQELIFKTAITLQRPVLDPCIAVGFLPLPSDGLRVGQLVKMQWRVERLKYLDEKEVSQQSVSLCKQKKEECLLHVRSLVTGVFAVLTSSFNSFFFA